ncbi:MAG TPA: hypothetical protein VN700_08620 [Vicinamibacterales bacterium]|nr:hypothetical protein [Vicinamibacterales bacterium]
MTTRRVIAVALAAAVSVATSPVYAQQAPGTLAGKATDEARQPYTDYAVQVRDVATGQVLQTQQLSLQGLFSFSKMAQARPYLIELYHQKERRVICTEGPYTLTEKAPSKLDVNINCGKMPAAFWLLLAGAGAAAAVAVGTRSNSR